MLDRQHLFRFSSRGLLLLAGLLYLLGAAADPLVHVGLGGAGGSEVLLVDSAAGDEEGGAEVPAHEEGPCLLCKASGPLTLALPPAGTVPAPEVRTPAPLAVPLATSPSSQLPSQPRAPPHV
jgi:hypothetical protein